MKEIKAKCRKCGMIKISGTWSNTNEEGFIVPVALAPTIQALGRVYNSNIGGTYEWNTGNKIAESFERKRMVLVHTNPDEDGEDWAEHKLQPLECWNEIT